MSMEAYIPFDLRERLAQQIKAMDAALESAVAAERERCAKVAETLKIVSYWQGDPLTIRASAIIAAAIRKGE